jgi:REP element-mobilizing transposase RayT
MKPRPGYEALRRHRVTIPGASYFVTLCTHDRRCGLNSVAIAGRIRAELQDMENEGIVRLQAAVIMPDQLHVLIIVLGRLRIGQVIGRMKAKDPRSAPRK